MLGFVDKLNKGLPPDGCDMEGMAYQMVPLGGRRDLLFQTDKSPCVLTVEDSSKITMRDFKFFDTGAPLPVPQEAHAIRLSVPNATIKFSLVSGNTVGFTGLRFVEEGQFNISSALTVSVKPIKRMRFCIVFLSDPIHQDVRGRIQPRQLMEEVKKVYLDQVNISFEEEEFPPPSRGLTVLEDFGDGMGSVTVPRNLGNPIVLSDDGILDAIEAATGEGAFRRVDLVVYCSWNAERKRGTNNNRGVGGIHGDKRYAFIEPARTSFAEQVHVLAHEIGHALGLRHIRGNGLMFENTNTLSNRLFAGDIEMLNPPPGGILP